MSNNRKRVLLCTGVSGESDDIENQYKKCLEDNGIECDILQVLQFEFVNLEELRNHMFDAESYSGLILTSPRAAAAVARISMGNPLPINLWKEHPIFCIGQTTESVTKDQVGLLNTLGTESGNAKNLANFMIDYLKGKDNRPLLLPCSDIARNTILNMLAEHNMEVRKVVVYKTKAHDSLKDTLNRALEHSPQVLVFYSPSIVENMMNALNDDKSIIEKFKNVAIGPVTQQAMVNAGLKVHGVSEKPEPKSLTEIIKNIM